jgi:hypothetical protein
MNELYSKEEHETKGWKHWVYASSSETGKNAASFKGKRPTSRQATR